MHRWRYPSLSIHGIQGCFSDPGAKTVIPRKVIGKFSIRLVPNQTPDLVEKVVINYIKEKWESRKSPNTMRVSTNITITMTIFADSFVMRYPYKCVAVWICKIKLESGGLPWVANPNHPNYRAASRATEMVYNETPYFTREGGSIPVTLTFQVYHY